MTEITSAYDWRGRMVIDENGEKIGKIEELYGVHQVETPEWASVHTGLVGTQRSFVPLVGATPRGEDVQVPVSRKQVNDAPSVEPDEELSERKEIELFQHYGVQHPAQGSVTGESARRAAVAESEERAAGVPPRTPGTQSRGRDVSGPATDDAMTRSEEELRVGTASRERGRVRLRKYVVTEEVQHTVPVRREEVRVEREPITDANVDRATDGRAISDEEHEMVLYEEEVVTEKRVVPKERVRLTKDTVTGEQQVADEVRKEQIDVDTGPA
jgi:uncharacterized protein (TIGR02271 family)